MHRVVSYLVNEIVVNGLSNSRAFQRFAVRTSKRLEEMPNVAAQKKRAIAQKTKDITEEIELGRNR